MPDAPILTVYRSTGYAMATQTVTMGWMRKTAL